VRAPFSRLRSTLRLVARGIRARGDHSVDVPVPRRRPAVERAQVTAPPSRVRAYLRATGGERIARFHGDDRVTPPTFPATWETAQALELFAGLEKPLPLGGIVHLSTELLSLRPLRPDDAIRSRVELDRADRVRRGLRLTLIARNWDASGRLVTQSTSAFLVRGGAEDHEPPEAAGGRAPEPVPPASGRWVELVRWSLGGGAGRRYARASGDFNPIHLWPWTARPFGFRRPILHGHCTLARAVHTLVEHRFGGDPTALRRIRVAFRAPLLLPAKVRFVVNEDGPERWFRVIDLNGDALYAEGTYGGAVESSDVDTEAGRRDARG
jgi:acyl dehydratase